MEKKSIETFTFCFVLRMTRIPAEYHWTASRNVHLFIVELEILQISGFFFDEKALLPVLMLLRDSMDVIIKFFFSLKSLQIRLHLFSAILHVIFALQYTLFVTMFIKSFLCGLVYDFWCATCIFKTFHVYHVQCIVPYKALVVYFCYTFYGKYTVIVNPDLIAHLVNEFLAKKLWKLWKKQVNGSGFNWSQRMLQLVDKK